MGGCMRNQLNPMDNYQTIKMIQHTNKKSVYLVIDKRSNVQRILKTINIDKKIYDRLLEYKKTIIELDHQNLVKIFELTSGKLNSENNILLHIISKFVDGCYLRNRLGKLTNQQILSIYEQARSALEYLHERDIVHQNLNLRTILLSQNHKIKLLDYGFLVSLEQETEQEASFYWPPQYLQNNIICKQTDIWQLGVVLLQLLTGLEINEITLSIQKTLSRMLTKKDSSYGFSKSVMNIKPEVSLRHTYNNKNFIKDIFSKYQIKAQFQPILTSLLEKDHKKRKFYKKQLIQNIKLSIVSEKPSNSSILLHRKTLERYQENNNQLRKSFNKIRHTNSEKLANNLIIQIVQNNAKSQIIQQVPKQFLTLDIKLTQTTDSQLLSKITQTNIQILICSNCLLTDQCGQTIKTLNRISKLDVSGNQLTDKFTSNIKQILKQITHLNISFTNITNQSIFMIAQQNKIEALDISYTRVTDHGIRALLRLQKLSSLGLWSGTLQYPYRYYDHIILNSHTNFNKFENNQIIIKEQTFSELQKLKLKQLALNINPRSPNTFIKNMPKSATSIEITGNLHQILLQNMTEMSLIQNIYLKDLNNYEITELKSRLLQSLALINIKLNISSLIKSLQHCQDLVHLDLSDNHIEDIGTIQVVVQLKKICKINSLNLSSNNISQEGAAQISKNLHSIQILNLYNNNIGNEGTTQIAKRLKNLKVLNLTSNDISNEGAIEIAKNLSNLVTLIIYNNNIGDEGGIAIAQNLKKLTTLNLSSNKIGNKTVISISQNLINLNALYLFNNNFENSAAIEMTKSLTDLRLLNLSSAKISELFVAQMAKHLKKLTTLYLSYNKIEDIGAIDIGKYLTNLNSLYLTSANIGDDGAISISKNLKQLVCLNLSSNTIGDYGAVSIAKNLHNLKKLYLSYNMIGNNGALEIVKNLKVLGTLYLSQNEINNEGAITVAKNIINIELLYLNNKIIDSKTKEVVKNLLKNIIVNI